MIVFLDIDGVLNDDASYVGVYRNTPKTEARMLSLLLPEKVALLNRLTDALGASLVISSYWRHPEYIAGLDVKDLLRKAGVTATIVGDTGEDLDANHPLRNKMSWYGTPKKRYKEIDRYIKAHNVQDYLVIDDGTSVKDFPPDRVIFTKDGLLKEHVARFVSKV